MLSRVMTLSGKCVLFIEPRIRFRKHLAVRFRLLSYVVPFSNMILMYQDD